MSDALIAGGFGALSGTSQFAGANIGQGGLKGVSAYQDAQKSAQTAQDKMLQSQADMAKAKIALEKGDETTAMGLQNQARQEQQSAAQFKLLGQHYASQDAASMALANARAGAGAGKGGLTDYQLGQLRDKAYDNIKSDKNYPLAVMRARNDAKKAGVAFDENTWLNQQVQAQMDTLLAGTRGANTMAATTPGAANAGGKLPPLDSFYTH